MRSSPKLSESDIVAQVKGFMQHREWRAVRMQRTIVPGQFQTGEPGIPDFQFVRYVGNQSVSAGALVLWVEFKARGVRAKCRCLQIHGTRKRCTACDQRKWRERERALGATVWLVDSLDWFMAEYERCFGWLHQGESARGQLELLGLGA